MNIISRFSKKVACSDLTVKFLCFSPQIILHNRKFICFNVEGREEDSIAENQFYLLPHSGSSKMSKNIFVIFAELIVSRKRNNCINIFVMKSISEVVKGTTNGHKKKSTQPVAVTFRMLIANYVVLRGKRIL